MGNCFAYARVSTPRQGERGVSLPEQRAAIEKYAMGHGLTIVKWFEERESAAKQGRAAFTEMLRLLRLGRAQGVIIHKIDRSARNIEDWAAVGKLVDAGVEVHFASENVDLRTVAGRLSADIQAVVAAHYSRNLREEVKKGMYGRLKQGFYPFSAPLGYLNQGAAKPKIPDPARAPLVREAFRLYATGKHSLRSLTLEMDRRGLRNWVGRHVPLNRIARLLSNPFYAGIMRVTRTGQTFPGVHEPLVSAELFRTVQETLAGKHADRVTHRAFTFSRIAKCASCGYSLIGELRKGHVYYRCHNRPFKKPAVCPLTSVREEVIDTALLACLAKVDLTDEEVMLARSIIAERARSADGKRVARGEAARLLLGQIETRLRRLTDLLLDGTIDKTTYAERREALLIEQQGAKANLADLDSHNTKAMAKTERTVELAKSPSTLYKAASRDKKRDLLRILLSNLSVRGKNVEITLAVPFRLFAERESLSDGGPQRDSCRTWEHIINELINNPKIEALPAF